MARMSIDDKLLRDPRAIRLGRAFGWRRQEAVGRLMDVFSLAYDRERDVIAAADIDIAAEQEGFADCMIEVDLAEEVRGGVRIKGAAERIAYLQGRHEAGRLGGLKSAETRRKKAQQKSKHTFDFHEAPGNPPDPVPDPPPDPVPDGVPDLPDPDPPLPRAGATPDPEPPAAAAAPPRGLERRQVLRAQIWASLVAARARVAAELGVPARPLMAQDPGEISLATLLATAGDQLEETATTALHVVAIAEAEARRDRSLQWLTGVIFEPRNFRRLAAMSLEDARRARPTKPGAPADPPRKPPRRADPPPAVVSDEERAAAAEVLAEFHRKQRGGGA